MKALRLLHLFLAFVLLAGAAGPAIAADKTQLTWLGHSAFRIDTPRGKILYLDPWIVNPANPKGKETLAAIDRADLILLTHGHGDHIGNAVEIAGKTGAHLVANFDLGKAMVMHAGFPEKQAGRDTAGHAGGEIELLDGEISVVFVPAVHGSGIETSEMGKKSLVYAGNPGGFIIKVKNGPTIYHTGDTDLFSDMALLSDFGKIDVMLVCIGDKFTMGPVRAASAVRLVKPRIAVPMHYGTFPALTGTPEKFEAQVKKLGLKTRVKTMKPGETLDLPKK